MIRFDKGIGSNQPLPDLGRGNAHISFLVTLFHIFVRFCNLLQGITSMSCLMRFDDNTSKMKDKSYPEVRNLSNRFGITYPNQKNGKAE